MGERKVVVYLVLILTAVSLVVTGIAGGALYRAAIAEERARLVEIAQSQARMIEAVARFDAAHSKHDHAGGAQGATLSQVVDAHSRYRGFGRTGEFTLARLEDDRIVFLLSHRHNDAFGTRDTHEPVPMTSEYAEPMRRALLGQSGTVVGLDYRGVKVLAAHEPVMEVNWGIVAKIDLAEVRAPFIRAGVIAGSIGLMVVLAGAVLFIRVSSPLIRRLEESEAQTRAIVETAADGIITVSDKGIVDSFNKAGEAIFGYAAGEVIGQDIRMLMRRAYGEEEGFPACYLVNNGCQETKSNTREAPGRRKDGTVFPMDLAISEVRQANRRMFTFIVRDVTERKRTEEALKLQSTALESAANAIVITDREGTILWTNDAFTRLTGYSREEAIGSNTRMLKSGVQDQSFYKNLWNTIFAGKVWRNELVNRRKNGDLYSEEMTITPVRDERGAITRFVAIKQDVTERKQAEKKLEKLLVDLERSNEELRQFAYVASHDLKEPLRMVASYTQLLEKRYSDRLDTDAKEFIHFAVDGATRMQRLIDDLLTYSRVGYRADPFEATDCRCVLDQVISNLSVAVAENDAVITYNDLPTVMADGPQMMQLFQNLLGNAIKFRSAHAPKIHVSAERNGQDWLFSFRDNGIGIDPQYSDRILLIFQRLHSRDKYPGTGIGLAICKKIVERHGGRIWFTSEPGEGSTFFFTIRADKGETL